MCSPAGAKGGFYRMGKEVGPDGPWEPAFDDPVFLAKLDKFLAAFAARYDGKPWLRYVDIGSIGDWGEGHSWAGSRKEVGFATRQQHVDLHLKHFKRATLVVSDDFVYALSNPTERAALHQYLLTKGISYRDDSILVNGYLSGHAGTWTVRSPGCMPASGARSVLHLQHILGHGEACRRIEVVLRRHLGVVVALLHRVCDVQDALVPQKVIELPDDVELAVDGLGLQAPPHQLVDVVRDLGVRDVLDRHIEPQHKASDRAQVVLNRVGRAVAPLEIAPPADNRIRHRRFLSRLQTWP